MICNSLTRDTVYYVAIHYISINNNIFKIKTETTERMCKYFDENLVLPFSLSIVVSW